ncbi:putative domain HDIG-containing protein [Desulfosporosinus orientis DSM 765]|uniref:Putative domain HDIG-containing protein n=1 Tax=Desulfosporosinus orientis (strain ATCC 19365 / DSM 765 / NCIMB 8382 / VKM B-1628 / Singapore I) TaxID=768706 RepID=G7WED0_DESOD|nr:HD-GYP domain-containing protein [Desulfosporosinus orientis]AET70743.1 putative domain HDIG-containing protein [Desulfosporosinus orientis DSM 765]
MESKSIKLKLFFALIVTSATVILIWNIIITDWNEPQLINLLIFAILAIASESLPVALPKGGYVTVSYSIFLSSLILFPLGVTLTAMALSGLLIFGKAGLEQPFYKRVFNASQYVISLSMAHVAISYSKITFYQFEFRSILFYFIAATIYMIMNMTIVAVVLGIASNKSPWSLWLVNFRWAVPNFVALVPLGFLLALIYTDQGALGILLLFIPLLISRHAFQLYIDMRDNYLNTIEALVQALEAKDPYTSGHSARVAKLAVSIAEGIKMSEEKIEFLKYAAVLHDVGKIGVSEIILNKEGELLDVEWEAIRSHPVIGQTIIKGIKFLFDIGQVVRHHHERIDGKGYPDGISGEQIPLESRIIAVADTYDAITSDRSYRKGSSHDEAVAELKRVAGTQLDPELVEVFCRVVTIEVAQRVSSEQRLQIVNVRGEVCS